MSDSDHCAAVDVSNIITKNTSALTPKPAASVRVPIALTSAHLILPNALPVEAITLSMTETVRNGTKRGK